MMPGKAQFLYFFHKHTEVTSTVKLDNELAKRAVTVISYMDGRFNVLKDRYVPFMAVPLEEEKTKL